MGLSQLLVVNNFSINVYCIYLKVQESIDTIELIPRSKGGEGIQGPKGELGPKGDSGSDGERGAKGDK